MTSRNSLRPTPPKKGKPALSSSLPSLPSNSMPTSSTPNSVTNDTLLAPVQAGRHLTNPVFHPLRSTPAPYSTAPPRNAHAVDANSNTPSPNAPIPEPAATDNTAHPNEAARLIEAATANVPGNVQVQGPSKQSTRMHRPDQNHTALGHSNNRPPDPGAPDVPPLVPSLVAHGSASLPHPRRADSRRVANRRKLEESGVKPAVLRALDNFSAAIPPIPNQVDHGRKTQNRDMRRWITLLQEAQLAPLWTALVDTLLTDSPADARLGDEWDLHLCRYILTVVVSKDNANSQPDGRNNDGRSQTRQAVNNAIKREVACPTESGRSRGKSAKSKTFRELFRERCRAAGVTVPPLDESQSHTAGTTGPGFPSNSAPPSPPHDSHASRRRSPPSPQRSNSPPPQSLPLSPSAGKLRVPPEAGGLAMEQLNFLRHSCPHTDEWGQTPWWTLVNDDDVRLLPPLLMQCQPFELRSLLTDFRWISRTFKCVDYDRGMRQVPTVGYDELLADVRQRSKDFSAVELEGFRLIRNAIMLIIPILKEDIATKLDPPFYAHLATQLTGRLLELKRRFPNIACLVHSIEQHAPRPWLRPLSRCFQQPRTEIKLVVPSNGPFTPHLIKLSEDGKILVTSGTRLDLKDGAVMKVHMIRVWDVERGKCILEDRDPSTFVRQLSLTRDNSCIIFETVEGLFFRHLQIGVEHPTITSKVEASPKANDITSITPTAHSGWVLTTHRRREDVPMFTQHAVQMQHRSIMSLWDTQTGKLHSAFYSVKSNANCVDVSANGKLFASGHDNGFIHLWNLHSATAGPVLSFKNSGGNVGVGPQPVFPLDRANDSRDAIDRRTISISFHERDGAQWVAAVSSDEVIRVWQLPPEHLIPVQVSRESESNEYLSTVCRAVIRRPRTRQVEWSQIGCLYSGGDDGMACEWERCVNGEWRWYSIDKNKGERMSEISASLISVGKRSGYVATYLTKSPYVVVWDMEKCREEERVRLRENAYRSHCAMKGSSVDVTDILDLTALRKTAPPGGGGGDGGKRVPSGISAYAENFGEIRGELESYFHRLDPKMMTRAIGDMQPRLLMELQSNHPLEVCFEQPVMAGVSGDFIIDESGPDWGLVDAGGENVVSGMRGVSGGLDAKGNEIDLNLMMVDGGAGMDLGMEGLPDGFAEANVKRRPERRGMVAALQDGSVALFELEGADQLHDAVKVEVKEEVKAEVKIPDVGGNTGNGKRKNSRSDEKEESAGVDVAEGDGTVHADSGGGSGNGDGGGSASNGVEGSGAGGETGESGGDGVRRSKRRRTDASPSDGSGNTNFARSSL